MDSVTHRWLVYGREVPLSQAPHRSVPVATAALHTEVVLAFPLAGEALAGDGLAGAFAAAAVALGRREARRGRVAGLRYAHFFLFALPFHPFPGPSTARQRCGAAHPCNCCVIHCCLRRLLGCGRTGSGPHAAPAARVRV